MVFITSEDYKNAGVRTPLSKMPGLNILFS